MVESLISASTLHGRVDDPDLLLADCRWYINDPDAGRVAYRKAHIPGARYVHLDEDLSARQGPGRHPLPSPEEFRETCIRLGINANSHVVAYDDYGGAIAARLWWMLVNQSHPRVSVLDGGINAWISIGGSLTDTIPAPKRGAFSTHAWTRTVDRFDVRNREAATALIDARSLERYTGEDEPVDPRAGHIPGAVSVPLTGNLNDDSTFLSPSQLRRRFAGLGLEDATGVISQCGSGVTACHNILAMTVAGMPAADLYVGSWSDWSAADLPVATGDRPR